MGAAAERLHGLEAREQALQQQLTEKTGLAASLELRTQQVRSMEDKVASLLGQLPGESRCLPCWKTSPGWRLPMGCGSEGISVLDEMPRQLYIEQPMQISASGAYHDLATFVSALGGLPQVVTVQDVTLGHQGALLRLDMLAKTYRSPCKTARPSGTRPRVAIYLRALVPARPVQAACLAGSPCAWPARSCTGFHPATGAVGGYAPGTVRNGRHAVQGYAGFRLAARWSQGVSTGGG